MNAHGNEEAAVDAADFLDGKNAERAVYAVLPREFFEHHALDGREREVFHRLAHRAGSLAEADIYRVKILLAHGEGQFVGEGECLRIARGERGFGHVDCAHGGAVGIAEREAQAFVRGGGVEGGDASLNRNAFFGGDNIVAVDCDDKRRVVLHDNVVYKYRALPFVVVYKGDVDALSGKIFQVYGIVGPFSRHRFGCRAGTLPLFVNHGALGAYAVDDGRGERRIFLLAGPYNDFEHVVGGGEIALRLELEHAEAVGDINLAAYHPVVACAGCGVHGVGGGDEVGAFLIIAHKAPRIVVGIGEAPGLHGGGGGEVVALPKHEADEAVGEVLA